MELCRLLDLACFAGASSKAEKGHNYNCHYYGTCHTSFQKRRTLRTKLGIPVNFIPKPRSAALPVAFFAL